MFTFKVHYFHSLTFIHNPVHYMFTVQIQRSLFKCSESMFKSNVQIQCSSLRFKFRVQIQCSNLVFKFGVQIQNSNSVFKFSVQSSMSRFSLQCSMMVLRYHKCMSSVHVSIDLQCLILISGVSQCPLSGSLVHEVTPDDDYVPCTNCSFKVPRYSC